jgi:hypothetical protein
MTMGKNNGLEINAAPAEKLIGVPAVGLFIALAIGIIFLGANL